MLLDHEAMPKKGKIVGACSQGRIPRVSVRDDVTHREATLLSRLRRGLSDLRFAICEINAMSRHLVGRKK